MPLEVIVDDLRTVVYSNICDDSGDCCAIVSLLVQPYGQTSISTACFELPGL